MSGPRTAHSSSWAASASVGTNTNTYYHPCVFLRSNENLENRAALDLELFVIRAFGKDYPAASSHVQSSPDCQIVSADSIHRRNAFDPSGFWASISHTRVRNKATILAFSTKDHSHGHCRNENGKSISNCLLNVS